MPAFFVLAFVRVSLIFIDLQQPYMKPLAYTIVCFAVLALCGCGTQSRFASSFGKRRYNKGYYWNRAGEVKAVASASYEHKAQPMVKPTKVKQQTVAIKQNNNPAVSSAVVSVKAPDKATRHKTILAKAVSTVMLAKAALPGGGRHEAPDSDSSQNSKLSRTSFLLFVLSIITLIISIFIIAYSGFIGAIVGGYLFLLLDIAAIIVAIVALTHPGETQLGFAKAVLIINLVLIVLLLAGTFA